MIGAGGELSEVVMWDLAHNKKVKEAFNIWPDIYYKSKMLRNRNRELVRIYFKVVKNIKRDPNNTRDLNNQLKDS